MTYLCTPVQAPAPGPPAFPVPARASTLGWPRGNGRPRIRAMIPATEVLDAFRRAGFELFTGVPCSYLTPLIDAVIDAPDLRYVGAANEGEAVAIAAGARVAGREAVVMFQNSGLGNAVNPLTSLNHPFRLPVLVLTTWRGQPGGPHDEPQHDVMGAITPGLLELMGIPWELFPAERGALDEALARARRSMAETGISHAFVLPKGVVEAAATGRHRTPDHTPGGTPEGTFSGARIDPDDALRALRAGTTASDALIATTGFTGRALYALGDRENQLYMVGSMGCASSFALGVALCRPERRVVVLDGDGAMLMHLGAAPVIGHEAPPNLVHVLLDNGVHDSTGAQATVAPAVDLARIALASGYREALRIETEQALTAALRVQRPGPRFLHVRTAPRRDRKLPRPTQTPAEIAQRFAAWL